MLHPVDPRTWLWGTEAIAFLIASLRRRELVGIELGGAMFATWLASVWALMTATNEQAFYITTFCDAAVGLGLALWMTIVGQSRRGRWIVGLFTVEMLIRLPAAIWGWWNENYCYDPLCVIFGLQVAIGGWPSARDTATDWRAAFRARRRLAHHSP
jgi:hypothetical protein